jgi:hypothetical protein
VNRDLHLLKTGDQEVLPGFEAPPPIRCFRNPAVKLSDGWRREFWAEEAGRAAAVWYPALARSDAFRHLLKLGGSGGGVSNADGWQLLYEAARDIGVNSSALVTQLTLEGLIAIERRDGRNVLHVQRNFLGVLGGWE